MTDLTIVRKQPRDVLVWFLGGAVVTLAAGMGFLAIQVNSLTHELKQRPTAEQFQALSAQMANQAATIAAKDARIKQLTDALVKAHVPVPVAPAPRPGLSPAPAAPSPSARPSASRSLSARPRATRAPSPTPSPSGPVPSLPPLPSPTLPVPSLTPVIAMGHGHHLGWVHRAVFV